MMSSRSNPPFRRPRRAAPDVSAAAAAAALVLLTAAAARSQPGPPPEAIPGMFGEVVEVRVINLEVVVTDRAGNRVPGLGRDAFRLLVDGVETPIEYFSEVLAGMAVQGPEAGQPVPAVLPGRPVGTSYLLFVDNFFSIARDRDRVLKGIRADLARLGPEDRMAIVTYDGRDLEMAATWSSSPEAVERALEGLLRQPSYGLQRRAEQQRFRLDRILDASGTFADQVFGAGNVLDPNPYGRLDPEERFSAAQVADQVQRSIAAATATLRSFASPPGRKVMLLLSGGWPFLPAEFVVADFSRPIFVEPGVSSGEDLYRPLTDTANLLGYTLYSVDVPGLEAQAADASQAVPGRPGVLGSSSFLRERENEYTLRYLADRTGGRALLNGAREEVFAAAAEDTRSYYWLGFSPQRQGDDRRHTVAVEVRDPTLRVRSRGGYLDSSRRREVTMQVESALLFGNPPSGEPLALVLGRAERAGLGKVRLGLTVGIPVDALTLLPAAEGQVAQLELRIAVMDAAGRQADVPVIPIQAKFEAPPAAGKAFAYSTQVLLRNERHRLVVAVSDLASGRILSGSAEVTP